MENIKHLLTKLIKMLEERKRTVLALSCLVVFVTTYMLILPAFTLEKDEAVRQGGIDIGTQASADVSDESVEIDGDGSDTEAADANDAADPAEADTVTDAEDDSSGKGAANSEADAPKTATTTDHEEAETIVSGDDLAGSLTFEGEGFSVAVEDTEGVLPSDTSVEAKELVEEPEEGTKSERKAAAEEYRNYYEKALEAINDESEDETEKKISFVKFYDITLQSGEDAIQPEKPVNVIISYDKQQQKDLKVEEKKDVRIIHFAEDEKNGEITAEIIDDKNVDVTLEKSRMTDTTFEAEGFSVYGIVYTTELQEEILTASGDKYVVTVSYGDDAGIPEGAKLVVSEINKDDERYESVCEEADAKLKESDSIMTKPVLLDISIVANGEKIEPAEGSDVKVNIKLSKEDLKGQFSNENAPVLINDQPIAEQNGEIDQSIQVVHQMQNGDVEVVKTEDKIGENEVTSSFTTDSFSDWLLFLDETITELRIGVNDTITLRPYSRWVWKSSEELEEYANYEWNPPQNNSIPVINFSRERKYDDQLREEYYFYHGEAKTTGEFDIQLKEGNVVKHTIHVTVVTDVDDTPDPIMKTEDIKVNLFDYDVPYQKNGWNQDIPNTFDFTQSGALDVRSNTANNSNNSTVNADHNLKFLGWGGGNEGGDGLKINNYTQDVPNQGILQNRLTKGFPTLSTGTHQSLDYLFDTSSKSHSVYAFPEVNGLFQKDSDGYYYYNSNSNYAYYVPNSGSFTLYPHTYSQWTEGTGGHNAKPIGFFPFHKYDSYLKEGNVGMNFNNNLNHHFGMSMTVDFEVPSDGLDDYGNPIVFEFSGDDDMWVFIDGNLVLDVGGIHQPVPGKINFSNDKVEVFGKADTTITQRFIDAGSPTQWEIGDGKPHTMKIFYLERGGCDSNLSVKFNTPIRFGKGKLSLVKREKNTTTPLANAKFNIWDNAKCQGDPIGEYTTGADGTINFGEFVLNSSTHTFYLKEVEGPDGYIRDTTVYQIKPKLDDHGDVVKDSAGEYVILDVCGEDGTPLTKLENGAVVFPNTKLEKINIPAKKTWECAAQNDASVTMTIKRFKLIDLTKGFMIVKELWGEPEGTTFDAIYKITYPDGNIKYVNYSAFSNGVYGIIDAVPGEYLIEESVRSSAPNGYHMTHTSQLVRVTLEEDGTAVANFKTTFDRDKGKLRIKENITVQGENSSDIDYSKVKYAVLDSSGRKVTSVTHEQAAAGIDLDLPVGTYSVKAVNVPEPHARYERTEQYVTSGNNRQDGNIIANIYVTQNNTTTVDFNTTFVKLNSAQNSTWKIKDQYHQNNQQYKSGVIDYPAGTKLRMTFQVPQSQAYSGNDQFDVTYGGTSLTGTQSTVQTNYEYSVDFTVRDNAELLYRINSNSTANPKTADITGPRFEVIEHAPHQASASPNSVSTNSVSSNKMLLSVKRLLAGDSLNLRATNSAKHPDAPQGKKYIKDSEWSQTITLNSGNSWQDTLRNLPASDDEGNKYYYYVDSVLESNLTPGTVCTIKLYGEDLLLIGQDLNQTASLEVSNSLCGVLEITKNIQTNGDVDTTKTGTFYYAVYDEPYDHDSETHADPIRTGSIIVSENGTATAREEGLAYGTYYVYELTEQGGTPIISGADGKYQAISDTVYKVTGSGTETTVNDTTGQATLNNNHETVDKTATKSWSDNTDHPTIYFKLFYEKAIGDDDFEHIEVPGAEMKALPNGTLSVEWTDLPKYDADGNEYQYLVKEYVKVGEEYVAAAPEGYVKLEAGLHVDNTKSEGYDPKTSYVGTKIWVDTANNGATRPESLHVDLYANGTKTDYTAQWTKGTGEKANEWTYTFSDLPVFDENGVYIQYTAVETPVNGYTPSDPQVVQTSYQLLDSQDEPERITSNSSLDITLDNETDLAYIAIKKNANKHLIWTQRAVTESEKQKLYKDINKVEGFNNELDDSTVQFISGLPIERVFEKGTVVVTKTSDRVMHVTFVKQNQWALLCYGSYKYNYAPGTTQFTNTLITTSAEAMKAWLDSDGQPMTPPEGTTVTFDLFADGVQQNKPIVLNGKIDVTTLSDDPDERATQEVNLDAVAAKAFESAVWKAYWGDLPECDSTGETITYTVKEITVPDDFANQNADGVASGGTITNKQTVVEINVLKEDMKNQPLTGAKFKLEKFNDDYQQVLKTWDEAEVSSETGKEGTLSFAGLGVGKYILSETQSPEGYIRTSDNPRFEVIQNASGNLEVVFTDSEMVTYESSTKTFMVKNEPGAALPNSGGIGTTIFYIFGTILVLCCGIYLIARRRMKDPIA